MTSLARLKERLLASPEVKAEYERLGSVDDVSSIRNKVPDKRDLRTVPDEKGKTPT